MKTLAQVLDGVTEGGQWRVSTYGDESDPWTVDADDGGLSPVAEFTRDKREADAAYAARAARSFPKLVRMLDLLVSDGRIANGQLASQARAILAEALKE